jgi:hypothetical protein
MPRESKLPKRLQPMLATLTDAPFDDPAWVFESNRPAICATEAPIWCHQLR